MKEKIEDKEETKKKNIWFCYTEKKIKETEADMTDCLYNHHTIATAER